MNVTYSDSVKKWEDGFALAQQGTEQLEEALGRSAGRVSAEWDRTEDEKGRAQFIVRLREADDEVTAKLAPDELRSTDHAVFRMQRLWDSLLQLQIRKGLDNLRRLIGGEGGGEN